MMMRYLGTGIGHRQPADFSRDIGQLKPQMDGNFYIHSKTQQPRQSLPDSDPIQDVDWGDDSEDVTHDSDDDEIVENIYEL